MSRAHEKCRMFQWTAPFHHASRLQVSMSLSTSAYILFF